MAGWKNIKFWIAGMLLAGLAAWIYYAYDPACYLFPRCPFLSLTGFKCPGCGSQRAFHQLLHGELGAAGRTNLLFVVALPYILLGIALEYLPWHPGRYFLRRRWYGYRATLVAFVVVSAFWLARNIWGF